MAKPDYLQTDHFAPPGMIPAFNELGNHPTDIKRHLCSQLGTMLGRLGIEEKYSEARELFMGGIDELMAMPQNFPGHHTPGEATLPIQAYMEKICVRPELCSLTGEENYEAALNLLDNGQNVILTPNHTSPLDGFIPMALFRDKYESAPFPRVVMSQVFEYARVPRVFYSGLNRYPVFQPKHMERFVSTGQLEVAHEMQSQNVTTMRALRSDITQGAKNIFLYLEKDRNTKGMGVPEPTVVGVLEMLERAKPGMHILPIHIAGGETVFPSRNGVNEMDLFMRNIQAGGGDVACGKPVPFSEVMAMAKAVDQREIIREVMGDNEQLLEDPKQRRLATTAITILSLVADLAPSEDQKGVYHNVSL